VNESPRVITKNQFYLLCVLSESLSRSSKKLLGSLGAMFISQGDSDFGNSCSPFFAACQNSNSTSEQSLLAPLKMFRCEWSEQLSQRELVVAARRMAVVGGTARLCSTCLEILVFNKLSC
jgi:hypothetical protein